MDISTFSNHLIVFKLGQVYSKFTHIIHLNGHFAESWFRGWTDVPTKVYISLKLKSSIWKTSTVSLIILNLIINQILTKLAKYTFPRTLWHFRYLEKSCCHAQPQPQLQLWLSLSLTSVSTPKQPPTTEIVEKG